MRRHVFFVAGYHPMTTQEHFRVFERELRRFAGVWSVEAHCQPPQPTPTGASWELAVTGANWRTETTFEVLAWDDLARTDMDRSVWSHLKGQARAVVDMITSGTLARYFRASRRYGLFFLFTYLLLAAVWLGAAAIGTAVAAWVSPQLSGTGSWLTGIGATLIAGLALMRWPGRKFHLKQSLDLAEFSVDFAHGRHREVDERVRAFARRIAAVAQHGEKQGDVDEIVLAGHSLGAMHLISALAHILDADPAFGTRVPVRLLTLGSTTAKFALHPAGLRLRQAAEKVARAPAIGWLEIQSRDDMVSFYKVNPVTLGPAEITDHNTAPGDYGARPLVRHAAIRDMISAETYRRFRFDVFRLHCQCFLAGDKRAHHDFYAYVCGPVPFDALAAETGGLLAFVDSLGRLVRHAADPRRPLSSNP